jgi:hypothetical protein
MMSFVFRFHLTLPRHGTHSHYYSMGLQKNAERRKGIPFNNIGNDKNFAKLNLFKL